MSVTIGGIVFDHVLYDLDADVLYLHSGDLTRASQSMPLTLMSRPRAMG